MYARVLPALLPIAFLLGPFLGIACADAPISPSFHAGKRSLPGGADLITLYGEHDGERVPLVAVLRDRLAGGATENGRLRYVWVLTSGRPSILQQVSSATPFFYWKTGFAKTLSRPSPVINLSAPIRPVVNALFGTLAQVLAADPEGALVRTATRSYRNNARDYRQLHLLEGAAILSKLEDSPEVLRELSGNELLTVQARLALGGDILGGLVSDKHLPQAYMKQRTRSMEDRGHNWELLRQRAEINGLIFEPFGDPGNADQAMLWVDREEAEKDRPFSAQFLKIASPYCDPRISHWQGYVAHREGRERIPLALYALDHPKAPLLVVDFRNLIGPKRREMIRHAFVDGVNGLAGISTWGNWPYFAGSLTWNFVRSRHGDATQRNARIRAYASTRQWLALETSLDPLLHQELEHRLERLGVNPLEDNLSGQAARALKQYAALESYVADPKGLAARLARDRGSEDTARVHGVGIRVGFALLHWSSLGEYRHKDSPDDVSAETVAGQAAE